MRATSLSLGGVGLAGFAMCGLVSWALLPQTTSEASWRAAARSDATQNEQSTALARKGPQSVLNGVSRRHFFFGHEELSDVLSGLAILSNSVDAFHNARMLKTTPDAPLRKRLLTSLDALPTLAARRIGMSEVYTLPTMYFLFEEDDAPRAYEVVRQGLIDDRVNTQVPLLAGFIAHAFLRDIREAAHAYSVLATRPKVPEWVGELASRLARGDDPYVTDPRARRTLCRVIARAFPRATRYLREGEGVCVPGKGNAP